VARKPRLSLVREGPGRERSREGTLRLECVGESKFQESLTAIAGGKRPESQFIETNAEVRREPGNTHDRHALQVWIAGRLVAYIPREQAAVYAPAMDAVALASLQCEAEIRGGWKDGDDEGSFGVVVYVPWPGTRK
jgi:hypothetical protein